MVVIHALWNNLGSGTLHLWAETSSLSTSVRKRRGRQPKTPRLQAHPYALGGDQIQETIEGLADGLAIESAGLKTLTVLLPSTSRGPVPSPKLVLEEQHIDEKTIELAPWEIPALALDPCLAEDFLLSSPGRPPRGMAFGDSMRFWQEAAKFSLELIIRQCFAPTLHEIRKGATASFQAAWEVVLPEDDAERMHLLSRTMPPVCRAFVSPDTKIPSSATDILSHFLNRTIDAVVRRSLSLASPLPPRRGRRARVVPLPEQWLQALWSEDPCLCASPQELKTFAREIQSWLGQLRPVSPDAPFRTCFRLEGPPENSGNDLLSSSKKRSKEWTVSYHLQARDDRSLMVPAAQVWKERSGVLTFLKRRFENPQERLLADLGKASRLFPAIEESLKTAHPVQLQMNTEQAYTFLRQSAPLLEQSGFGVLLPPWWNRPSARLGVKLKLKPAADGKAGAGLMGLNGIVAYDWMIAIGDQTLTAEEFKTLANLKIPLVKVRGQWVELRPEEIEEAIAFFMKKHGDGKMGLGEALRFGLGQERSESGLKVTSIEGDGWIGDVLDRLSHNEKISTVKPPRAFRGQLRPYQMKGLSWLAFLRQFGFGACLADDMGLGKTIQLIALLLHERAMQKGGSRPGPTLLVCPMSIVGNWQREIRRFAPSLKVMVHHGGERLSGRSFAREARKHDIVVTTYSTTHRDEELLAAVEWGCITLDEAQNIKNQAAKQTQSIKKLSAKHRIALTGTPVENRLSELWSIMEFLNKGFLGSAKDFRATFAIPIERYRDPDRAEALRRLIRPFILRRLKTDKTIIKDLPEKMEMNVFCNLTREQASLYEAVLKDMLGKIEESEGIERKGLVLAVLVKLKQICNHPAQFLHDGSQLPNRSGKLARLEEMIEEAVAEGDKALIFTQFSEMGAMLRSHLQSRLDRETLFLYGGTAKKQRDAMVQRFQEERLGPPLFVLSLKAGGLGLNLTAANHVFHFDRWWNPAVENQATDRAFRIGQKKNVQVHKFVCVGTLEERIDQMIQQKKELTDRIVGTGEEWITEMSTAQLKQLFALSTDAVGGE